MCAGDGGCRNGKVKIRMEEVSSMLHLTASAGHLQDDVEPSVRWCVVRPGVLSGFKKP